MSSHVVNACRSPILSHYGECLKGLTVIRAYRVEDVFQRRLLEYEKDNAKAYFHYWAANQWVTFWLEVLGNGIVALCGTSARDPIQLNSLYVYFGGLSRWKVMLWTALMHCPTCTLSRRFAAIYSVVQHKAGGLDAGTAGFLLSYVMQLPGMLMWIVRSYSRVETELVSVERIGEYIALPQERTRTSVDGSDLEAETPIHSA